MAHTRRLYWVCFNGVVPAPPTVGVSLTCVRALCCCFVVEVGCTGTFCLLLLRLGCTICHPLNEDTGIGFVCQGGCLTKAGGSREHASGDKWAGGAPGTCPHQSPRSRVLHFPSRPRAKSPTISKQAANHLHGGTWVGWGAGGDSGGGSRKR